WVYTPYMACAGMYKFTKFMLEIVIKVLCNASDKKEERRLNKSTSFPHRLLSKDFRHCGLVMRNKTC
ncbi:MAG: hypothetical protein XD78_0335, partial [Desulfotomaculum sp. 46_296]